MVLFALNRGDFLLLRSFEYNLKVISILTSEADYCNGYDLHKMEIASLVGLKLES